ncbi:hypothetical protein [Streptomyces sp. NBC_01451]|uniref:hypothetical protein n=1 Tax=Streptomyces sp. NBC_01451 TaxID=2903872 RepID=UPI002E37C84D|nr:hypothetical protein [Streptomyces sp. NBC_01451]
MADMTSPERERRLPVALLVVACCVFLVVAGAILAAPLGLSGFKDNALPKPPKESHGIPGAALQKTFRLAVPAGARDASYLVVPGDGSAESSQDLYLRFRTTPAGLKGFLTSLDKTTGDLTADDAVLDQDDIDSVELPWKIGTKGHLAGLYADIPEQGDTVGTALLTVDESKVAAPLVYAHVTV